MINWALLVGFVFLVFNVSPTNADAHYLNEWVAHIEGGTEHAREVAKEHGYEVEREVMGFGDHYILKRRDVPHRSRRAADHHTRHLEGDTRVNWAEQQTLKVRQKRGYLKEIGGRELTVNSFNDPLILKQWYLYDSRKGDTRLPKEDLHVLPVWNKNITGKGVIVTVLDDGLEKNHTDLAANYDPQASYDFNENDPDPHPRYDDLETNKHGTRCAGEIAMVANNNKCGVGLAYNAKLGGIKMLDGKVTDTLEGEALAFNCTYVDVYSASWGPTDDGKTMEAPGKMASAALKKGIETGRKGKGVIYVWASGNGGRFSDNCNCDGYTGSIYTLSVSSASQTLELPWYGERCSSTISTTYSSGRFTDAKVATTDLHNLCTEEHSGTSAAAPLAAGIVALVLEANPNLTWRDMQHLAVWTSEYEPLMHTEGWYRNGRGLWVNTAFGFGLMNAASMVAAAEKWTSVPPQQKCVIRSGQDSSFPRKLKSGGFVEVIVETSGCKDQENEINYLEHVVVRITVDYSYRGAISIQITSPSGTKTSLLDTRDKDESKDGYVKWALMSVHNWGESARGKWTLYFQDSTGKTAEGEVKDVEMELYGTKTEPEYWKNGPRVYSNYNKVENERKAMEKKKALELLRRLQNSEQEDVLLVDYI